MKSTMPLMPAQAGIQSFPVRAVVGKELGPRFRGDERRKSTMPLMPAQAGIQSFPVRAVVGKELGPRFRGDERGRFDASTLLPPLDRLGDQRLCFRRVAPVPFPQ